VAETGYSPGDDCFVYVPGGERRQTGASWRNPGFDQSEKDPVVCVSWRDTMAYIAWLNGKIGSRISDAAVSDSGEYRLPSEAEWEYAARAGRSTTHWWGDSIGSNNANCAECGSIWDKRRTSPGGRFSPNPYGLYDMLGNAQEATRDCWHSNYEGAPSDGSAWMEGDCTSRPVRGGAWSGAAWGLTPVMRAGINLERRSNECGFRVAKAPPSGGDVRRSN
jgi:formylglycine-generating enzyme required for sulfatase activity